MQRVMKRNFEELNGNANPVLRQERDREIANLEAIALGREITMGLQEVKEHIHEENLVSES